jgi:hypothetical protein
MPNFGTDVTSMSAPNLQGAKFISPGVVDKSGAMSAATTGDTVGTILKTGVDAYHGAKTAEIDKQQQSLIQEYMDKKDPRTIFKEADFTNPVQINFQAKLDRFKVALDQGVMTPEEFQVRSLTLMRNATNANPGMLPEFADQVKNVMELSGMTDILKQDIKDRKSQTKSNDKLLGDLRTQADLEKIDFNHLNPDYVDMNKKLSAVRQEQTVLATADRQDKFTVENFRDFGSVYVNGLINKASDAATEIFKDNTMPYEKKLSLVRSIFQGTRQTFNSDPRVGKITDSPVVQQVMKQLDTSLTTVENNLKTFSSGEDAAAYLHNKTQMERDNNYMAASSAVNPEMVDVFSKLQSVLGIPGMLQQHPELMTSMYMSTSKLLSGIATQTNDVYYGFDGKNPKAVDAINSLTKDSLLPDGEKSTKALQNVIGAISADSATMSPSDKFNFQWKYVQALGKSTNKEGLQKLDAVSIARANDSVKDYTTTTMADMKDVIDKYSKNEVKIQIGVLGDGRMTIQTSDPTITNELNKKYSIRINDSLAAYANLNGFTDGKAAHEKFYNEYSNYFPQPDVIPKDGLSKQEQITSTPIQPVTVGTIDSGDAKVIQKMIAAREAGASTDQIAGAVRRSKEWVQEQLDSIDTHIRTSMQHGKELVNNLPLIQK